MTVIRTNDGIRVQSAWHCPLCAAEGTIIARHCRDRLFEVAGLWSIRECNTCGLAWLDPRPCREDIPRLYKNYFTHDAAPTPPTSRPAWRSRLHRSILTKTLGYPGPNKHGYLATVAASHGLLRDWAHADVMWLPHKTGRLLDVGCGSGEFLGRMKSFGWHAEGVDPDPKAARIASQKWGVLIHAGMVEDLSLPAASYDAVTLSHVIEHVHDPVATLHRCADLLKDDGTLVVATPNRESLAARRFGPNWVAWDPPRHLHVFTTRSLAQCAKKAGLEISLLRTTARGFSFNWLASKHLVRAPRLTTRPTQGPLWRRFPELLLWLAEHSASRLGPVGEEVLMIARRSAATTHGQSEGEK